MKQWGKLAAAVIVLIALAATPVAADGPVQETVVYMDGEPILQAEDLKMKDGVLFVDAKAAFTANRMSWREDGNALYAERPGAKIVLIADSSRAIIDEAYTDLQHPVERNGKGPAWISLRDFALLTGKGWAESMNGQTIYLTSAIKDRIYFVLSDSKTTYAGETSGGRKSGNGMLSVNDAVLYEGQFSADRMNGYGKLYLDGQLVYEGGFRDDVPHGTGTLYLASGERYEGPIEGGLRHGYGKLYRGNALIYDGEWSFDRMTGDGQVYNGSGQLVYSGHLVDGVRDGFGIAYRDGRKHYQGQWLQGSKHGEGILYDDQGALAYIGSFVDDERSGAGTAASVRMMTWYKEGEQHTIETEQKETLELDRGTFANGVQISRKELLYYTGDTDENKVPSGIGQLYRYDGKESTRAGALTRSALIYDGEVLAGLRHGIGKAYENGRLVYEGEFRDDMRRGSGKAYENGLLVYDGQWAGNYRNGIGKAYQYAGNVAGFTGQGAVIVTEGHFVADKLRTVRQLYRYAGELKNGAITGFGSLYMIPEGSGSPFSRTGTIVYTGSFQDGRKHGAGKLYSGGIVSFDGRFANDMKNGPGIEYSGYIKRFEGHYTDDKREGEGIEYDAYGRKLYEGFFKNNMRDGYGKLYENGQLVYDGDFAENKKHGKGRLYKNGTLVYEGEFIDDERADGQR